MVAHRVVQLRLTCRRPQYALRAQPLEDPAQPFLTGGQTPFENAEHQVIGVEQLSFKRWGKPLHVRVAFVFVAVVDRALQRQGMRDLEMH